MKTTARILCAIGVVALTASALAACSRSSSPDASASGAPTSKVQVGVVEDLTGTAGASGQSNVCGILIANDALAAGLIPGKPVDLNIQDSQTAPAVASQAAAKLTGQGIKLFVGGTGTNTLLPQIPIINQVNGLTTGGNTKSTQILSDAKYGFRLNGDNTQDGQAIASHLAKDLNAKTIAIIAEQGSFGDGAVAAIKSALPSSITITDVVQVAIGETNFVPSVTRVKAENTDAIVWLLSGTAGPAAIVKELAQEGLQKKDVPGAGLLNGDAIQSAGSAADGVIGLEVWSPTETNAANKVLLKVWDKYRSKHQECSGKPLDKSVALSYSQLALLAAAIQKTGSVDPATLRKAIVNDQWNLPQGTVTFDQTGQAVDHYVQYTAKNGKIVPLN